MLSWIIKNIIIKALLKHDLCTVDKTSFTLIEYVKI